MVFPGWENRPIGWDAERGGLGVVLVSTIPRWRALGREGKISSEGRRVDALVLSLSTRFGSLLGGNGKPRAGCGRVQVEKHAASQRKLQAGVFAGRDRRATALASVVQRWDLACVLLLRYGISARIIAYDDGRASSRAGSTTCKSSGSSTYNSPRYESGGFTTIRNGW